MSSQSNSILNTQQSQYTNAQRPVIENAAFDMLGTDFILPQDQQDNPLVNWNERTRVYTVHRDQWVDKDKRDEFIQATIDNLIKPQQAIAPNVNNTQLSKCKENLGVFRQTKPDDIHSAAIMKTKQFLQSNPALLPDLAISLSTLSLKNRDAVDEAWVAVEKAEKQFGDLRDENTQLRDQASSAKATVAAHDMAYQALVKKTDNTVNPILQKGVEMDAERENERQLAEKRIADLEKANADLLARLEQSQTAVRDKDAEILELDQKFLGADKLAKDTNILLATSEESLAAKTAALEAQKRATKNMDDRYLQLSREHASCAGELIGEQHRRDAWRTECETARNRVTQLEQDLAQAATKVTELENNLDLKKKNIEIMINQTLENTDRQIAEKSAESTRLHAEAIGRLERQHTNVMARVEGHRRNAEERSARAEQDLRASRNQCEAFQRQFKRLKLTLNPANQFPTLQDAAVDVSSRLSSTMLEIGSTGWYMNTMEACKVISVLADSLGCCPAPLVALSSADKLRNVQNVQPERFATKDGLLMTMVTRHLLLLREETNELAYLAPEQFQVETDGVRGFRVVFKGAPMMGDSATSFWSFDEGIPVVPVVFAVLFPAESVAAATSSG